MSKFDFSPTGATLAQTLRHFDKNMDEATDMILALESKVENVRSILADWKAHKISAPEAMMQINTIVGGE